MSQMIYGIPGSFCWAELFTDNESESLKFYSKLFSWTYSESAMPDGSHYTHAMISEGAVAGVMQIGQEMKKHGVMPHWNSYIAVNNIDETIVAAVKQGASIVMPAMDVPNAGRMAFIKDPTGAHISLWQARCEKPAPARNLHGMVGWNELLTSDVNVAKQFYIEVFGWGAMAENINGKSYVSFTKDGKFVGGMMQIDASMGPMPSCWTVYFTTNDLESSRQIAKAASAIELSPVIELPNIGKLLVIKGPDGAVFSLFQWAENK